MKRNLTLGIALFLLAFALVFTGCPEPEKPKDVPANTSETRPQALTNGDWYDGEIVVRGNEIWFSFPVTASNGYYVNWNDSYFGDSTKTADIYVNAKYQGAPDFLMTSDRDSAWDSTYTIFPVQTGTILLKVRGLANTSTGTFAIKYVEKVTTPGGTTETSPQALTNGVWYNGELGAEGGYIWFSFPVTNSTNYSIEWNDSYQGDSTKTADIYVSAKYQGASNNIITDRDSAWTTAATVNATQNGTLLLRVRGITYGTRQIGTFAIKYTAQ
jgi:hypothetical protein